MAPSYRATQSVDSNAEIKEGLVSSFRLPGGVGKRASEWEGGPLAFDVRVTVVGRRCGRKSVDVTMFRARAIRLQG